MELLRNLVLVVHLLGMAAILGGWLVSRTSPRVHPVVLWGARAQILTGLLLVGLVQATSDDSEPVNNAKFGVKLLVALAVVACVEIANARQKRAGLTVLGAGGGATTAPATATAVAAPLVQAAAGLTLLNVLVAVLWT